MLDFAVGGRRLPIFCVGELVGDLVWQRRDLAGQYPAVLAALGVDGRLAMMTPPAPFTSRPIPVRPPLPQPIRRPSG